MNARTLTIPHPAEASRRPRRLGRCGLALVLMVAATAAGDDRTEYPDFYSGRNTGTDKGIIWVQSIAVSNPAYGASVKGDVSVSFRAPGMTKVRATCWQQPSPGSPDPWGHAADLAPGLALDPAGHGTFVFHADQFPRGPVTVRLFAKDDGRKQDLCELQLFNEGGVVWNQGIPGNDPPAARGMKLAFSDDFTGPVSVSDDGRAARYEAHKTGGGDFSGWPFANVEGANNPFSQANGYLRIHASKRADGQSSSGLISSAHEDGSGFYAHAPCYFECRFLAQSATGTWPAFWLLTKNCLSKNAVEKALGSDELDIIEAYGGRGEGNPNFPDYAVTTHCWNQKDAAGKPLDGAHRDVPMVTLGGKSTWSETFHTYGIKITPEETVYYLDDIEVFRHPTKPLSKSQPFWFLVNYAIGGISGWKVDLSRYNNASDMWVDYVRVYQGGD